MTSIADFLAGTDDPDVRDEPAEDVVDDPVGTVTERVVNDQFVRTDDGQTRPVCSELGCENPCRKRRNSPDFFPYCAKHNAMHSGSAMASPKSHSYAELEERRAKAARDVEERIKGLFLPFQVGLMASGDVYCATALGVEVPPLAKAIGDLSADFPWLASAVGTADKWSALAQLAFHAARLAVMVSVHHEWVPYEGAVRFFVPHPDSVKMSPGSQSYDPSTGGLRVVPDGSESFT